MKKKSHLLLFVFIVLARVCFAQPGPSDLYMVIYDKQGNRLGPGKETEVFSYCQGSNYKMSSYPVKYESCGALVEMTVTPIVIEVPENIVSIVHKNDTMNIVIQNYAGYGHKLFLDSVVFCKGAYEAGNKFDLNPDTCSGLITVHKKYLTAVVPALHQSCSSKKEEEGKTLKTVLAEEVKMADSLGTKYIKFKYHYGEKEYSATYLLPENFKMYSPYRVVVSFEKEYPEMIREVRSYPNGY